MSKPIKILHFADAHIDQVNHGKHDPVSGLPVRVMDFLRALDVIIEAAISEKVDLVIFAGDAYKDRSPAPTFQREWGRRIMRLARASIPTLLLVGNHDLSPALNRAHALDAFATLEPPFVRVLDKPQLLGPADLWDLPLQVIALPWITRSAFIASQNLSTAKVEQVDEGIQQRLEIFVQDALGQLDPTLPVVLTAHATIQGASYGKERDVMLGGDLVLPGALVRDQRLDYVALGHIHKPQDLNKGSQPPAIYPGSIERIDFGEPEQKYFIIASVTRGHTDADWRPIPGLRVFHDIRLNLIDSQDVTGQILAQMPSEDELADSITHLSLTYPKEMEALIDEGRIRQHAAGCLEFRLLRRPEISGRVRLPEGSSINSLTPLDVLELYWRSNHLPEEQQSALQPLASQIVEQVNAEQNQGVVS